MLEKQMWIPLAPELMIEWEQCMDEGKCVEEFKELCAELSKRDGNKEAQALELYEKMNACPMKKDYPYVEPSDLEGIQKARPKKRHLFNNNLNDNQLVDKLTGAWIGRISGCLLGKPVEGFRSDRLMPLLKGTDNYPMKKYICTKDFSKELITELNIDLNRCWADQIDGIAPIDDDTNYTVFAMKLIEEYGRDFRPNDVLEAWLLWIPYLQTCTAERVAYKNAAMGLFAPETATYKNPFREWIGAQIRGDFFGYINPACPTHAAELAWRDASISHTKNGIYGEMLVSAMIAAAAVCDDIRKVIEAGIDEIPERCRLRRDIDLVIAWHDQGLTSEKIIEQIHQTYDETSPHGWCHTNSNAMVVVMALLCGNKDFGKSICLAVQAAFDTDCNGATVGSIIGIMLGGKQIQPYWTNPYHSNLSTSIIGYNQVSIAQLVEKTKKLIHN